MKQYKYLYREMLKPEVIRQAYKNLRKGKTKREEIKQIDDNYDEEAAAMRAMIENTRPGNVPHPELAYKPRKRTPKIIKEHGKERKIYMPEIHEQWLHHIIILVLQPIITRTAYRYTCGSFPGRGAHYAKRRLERWIRSNKGIRNFGKIDIRHFYDSIRHKILFRELRIRIKDEWFLYVVGVCLQGFKRGLPLGFYISQWLANYLLEPLDLFIREKLGIEIFVRYMDDISMFDDNKKKLQSAIIEIRKYLGRRFRLKLKDNYQVAKFYFVKKNGKVIGRALDFMGFLFFRNRTTIRKSIMLEATRQARKLKAAKEAGRAYYLKHVQGMVSYMGWFDCTDSYNCYFKYLKPYFRFKKLKEIISKLQRRQNKDEKLAGRALLREAGSVAACSA